MWNPNAQNSQPTPQSTWTRTSGLAALAIFLLFSSGMAEELQISARSLQRADLPNDFPFQILHEGFAVIRVRLQNATSLEIPIDLATLDVRSPGNKKLKRALPTEIAPKLMKYYRGGRARVLGEAHIGRRPTGPDLQRAPTIGASGNAGSIDVSTGGRLRTVLESYELPDDSLSGGESVEGLIYVRSKKSGTHLKGGSVQVGDSIAVIP